MLKKAAIFVLGCFLSAGWILGQSREFRVRAVKIEGDVIIDGVLDEEIWDKAPVVSDYIQFEPNRGAPASVRTEARILYDNTHIYFGFVCYDPDPDKIVLGTSRRDQLLMGTDSVTVTLDTYHDKRTGYYFRTNIRGVQHDGSISDNGRVADVNWDGIWKSAGAKTEYGWSAEMAIPLATIKFKRGKDQTWGFQTSRYFPRNLEKSFWFGPVEDYRKMSEMGILAGLDLEQTGNKMQIIPHVLTRLQEKNRAEFEAGLDARYDFTPSLSGHLTVNPDFATVEADQEQINSDPIRTQSSRKEKFFPGRKPYLSTADPVVLFPTDCRYLRWSQSLRQGWWK